MRTHPLIPSLFVLLSCCGVARAQSTAPSTRPTADDYARVDRALAKHLPARWATGDFNYDGTLDDADYLLIDRAFAIQGHPLSPAFLATRESQFGPDYASALLASIPEPSLPLSALLYSLSSLSLKRRRR